MSVGCSRGPADAVAAPDPAPIRVQVATVQSDRAARPVEIPGIVRPTERAALAAKISGTIDTLSLTLGQTVRRGEVLIRLTAPELTARLAQMSAQLEQAAREEKRDRELAATGADTADTAHGAAEHLRVARAAVAEAEAMLAYTEIRAPYDGRIAQKLAYPGDFATPGSPLLVLERSPALQIEAAVPVSLVPALTPNAKFVIEISGVATPTIGHVSEIAAAADAATHTVLAKFDLASPDPAWSGRAVRVQLPAEPTEALWLPASCIAPFGQMERVFIVNGGKVQLRLVKTGSTLNDRVELLAGVAPGEKVVIEPGGTLHDGQRVIVTP